MKQFVKSSILTAILIAGFRLLSFSADDNGDRILGMWLTASKNARIQIYKANGAYYGKIHWANDLYESDGKKLRLDLKNEDKSKRSRTIKNLVLLNNFKFQDGIWTDGTIYDPQNGKTYKCKITLSGSKLSIRGYIGISLLGRTEVWTRVEN